MVVILVTVDLNHTEDSFSDNLINKENEENPEKSMHSNKEAYILTMAIYFHTIF